jgi:hypothetical protein
MSNLNNVQRRLAEGTSSWLLFEFHCKRGDLFSEKYLTVPVGQILTGLFPGQIKSEVNHPLLLKTSRVGRPPQLDFVIVKDGIWQVVIETKWVGKTEITVSQIIWDLMRLEILARLNNSVCYFILAGFNKKIVSLLENTHFNSSNPVKSITTLTSTKISIDLSKLQQPIKDSLNVKMGKYPTCYFSEVISCDIPHFYPEKNINMSFKTLVWKVNAYNKSRKIRAL